MQNERIVEIENVKMLTSSYCQRALGEIGETYGN